MSRSSWKGPFIDKSLLINVINNNKKIYSRRSIITSNFIGKSVLVYNGKLFKKIFITREKIGFKFGEFCFTRQHQIKNTKTQK
jgi:small subunit ribosomal protein S19